MQNVGPWPPSFPLSQHALSWHQAWQRHLESSRRTGRRIYTAAMALGALLLVWHFVVPALLSRHAGVAITSLFVGALLALPMLALYVWVPRLVDRYDPEPTWALAMAVGWGGIAACGIAASVNTAVHHLGDAAFGERVGSIVTSCVSAPVVEELAKGAFVLFMSRYFRRDFDGVVDGVIYGTFVALGFACVEDVIYYSRAMREQVLLHKDHHLLIVFILRGVVTPWGHPLYTSMTGIGIGVARETDKRWLKWFAPLAGLAFAVLLHATWNGAATFSGFLFVVMLPLWLLFVLAFFALVLVLVRRKGRIIEDELRQEVLLGYLTVWEARLASSPFARSRAKRTFGGSAGRAFVETAARLAIAKWHVARAARARSGTASASMVTPYRRELARLRAEVSRALGRPLEWPAPWTSPRR